MQDESKFHKVLSSIFKIGVDILLFQKLVTEPVVRSLNQREFQLLFSIHAKDHILLLGMAVRANRCCLRS